MAASNKNAAAQAAQQASEQAQQGDQTPPDAGAPPPPLPPSPPIIGQTDDPMGAPSTVTFQHDRCGRFVLHDGIGYPGDITVEFIGGIYTPANKAEEFALRKIAQTDKGLKVV